MNRLPESCHSLSGFERQVLYQTLIQKVAAPRVGLSDSKSKAIRDRLAQLRGGDPARLCCLYLRYEAPRQKTSRQDRNGSPLECYLPAIRWLVANGWQVLLTGDRRMSPELAAEFCGWFVDAELASLPKSSFNIFAATEANVFIGECGGGLSLPIVNSIPLLGLNIFPFHHGFPNSWCHYKGMANERGERFAVTRLFGELLYSFHDFPGILVTNSADEILEAVQDFMAALSGECEPDYCRRAAQMIPINTVFHQVGAKLSPAWVRFHAPELLSSSHKSSEARVLND